MLGINMDQAKRWALLLLLAVFLGIETARMIVYMPDWIEQLIDWISVR